MLQGTPNASRAAKRLRREMTLPEVLLWQRLRQKPNGLKFRRQHPAGNWVADVYCHSARTIIEVDGIVHDMGKQALCDEARDEWLRDCGLRVLRIPARDVLSDPDRMAEAVVVACCGAAERAENQSRPL